jgi:hypothetical protein
MKTESPAVEKTFAEAFAARPTVSANEANMRAILDWLTENLKPFNAFTVLKAIDAINASQPNLLSPVVTEADRARQAARLDAMLNPPSSVAPVAPPPVPTEQEQLQSLQRDLRSSDPKVVAAATAELKARANGPNAKVRFNRLYSKKGLEQMTKLELDSVVRLYGAGLVSGLLNS